MCAGRMAHTERHGGGCGVMWRTPDQAFRALLDCYRILRIRFTFDNGGKSHHTRTMPTLTLEGSKQKRRPAVVEDYDVAADAKKRISLRNAKTKYFHVKAFSNGCFLLEPRVLVSPEAISARSLKMLDKSAANLKKGLASAPIDLAAFADA